MKNYIIIDGERYVHSGLMVEKDDDTTTVLCRRCGRRYQEGHVCQYLYNVWIEGDKSTKRVVVNTTRDYAAIIFVEDYNDALNEFQSRRVVVERDDIEVRYLVEIDCNYHTILVADDDDYE